MSDARNELLDWAQRGRIAPDDLPRALELAGVTPDAARWRNFIDALLLWLGVALLGAGVIFFFAFNWDVLGRFGKFALVELPLAATVLAAWRLGLDRPGGQAALLGATILTGALLALIGQTYQTGADPWELFAVWALLVLPWTIAARFDVLWLVVVVLLNLAVTLYFQAIEGMLGFVFGKAETLWALFGLNVLALIAWELAAMRCAWLRRWGARTIAAGTGSAATMIALWWMFESAEIGPYALAAYLAWMALAFAYYRYRLLDVFMLSGGVLSAIIVIAALLGRHVLHRADAGGFLLMGLLVIGLSAAGAWWIRRVVQAQHP